MALRKSPFGTHAAQVPPAKFGSYILSCRYLNDD